MLTVDASVRYQTITGFGVNGQPRNWGTGVAVKPALQTLVREMNATLWRIEIHSGRSNWELKNDDASPSTFNWPYFEDVFANTKSFQDLWAYVRYLNELGVTNIELAAHGTSPTWMGGIHVPEAMYDEYVETQLAVLEYAVLRIPDPKPVFRYFSPFNEPEIVTPPEGIALTAAGSAKIVSKLVARLNLEKLAHPELGKIRLIAPEVAYERNTARDADFRTLLTNDATVAPWLAAIAHHSYSPQVTADWNGLGVVEWLTEVNGFRPTANSPNCGDTNWKHALDLAMSTIGAINAGVGAVMVWTEYDAPHSHDDDQWETFGLLETRIAGFGMPCGQGPRVPSSAQLDSAAFSKKPTYHAFRQIAALAQPGATRIQVQSTDRELKVTALQNPDGGAVLIGINSGGATSPVIRFGTPGSVRDTVVAYATTESEQFIAVPTTSRADGLVTAAIPARSIFAVATRRPGVLP